MASPRYGCDVVFVGKTMPAIPNTAAAAVGRFNPPTMQAVTLGAVDSIVHREHAAFCVPEDVILQGTVQFDGYANVLMEKTENNKAELAFQGKQEGSGKEFSVDVPLPVGPMKANGGSHSHWNVKGGGVGQMKKGEIQFNPDHVSDGQHAFTLTRGQRYFVSTSAPLLRQQFELKLLKGKKEFGFATLSFTGASSLQAGQIDVTYHASGGNMFLTKTTYTEDDVNAAKKPAEGGVVADRWPPNLHEKIMRTTKDGFRAWTPALGEHGLNVTDDWGVHHLERFKTEWVDHFREPMTKEVFAPVQTTSQGTLVPNDTFFAIIRQQDPWSFHCQRSMVLYSIVNDRNGFWNGKDIQIEFRGHTGRTFLISKHDKTYGYELFEREPTIRGGRAHTEIRLRLSSTESSLYPLKGANHGPNAPNLQFRIEECISGAGGHKRTYVRAIVATGSFLGTEDSFPRGKDQGPEVINLDGYECPFMVIEPSFNPFGKARCIQVLVNSDAANEDSRFILKGFRAKASQFWLTSFIELPQQDQDDLALGLERQADDADQLQQREADAARAIEVPEKARAYGRLSSSYNHHLRARSSSIGSSSSL